MQIKIKIVSLCFLLLTGCTQEGQSFIAIHWDNDPFSYSDNNPGTPAELEKGEYYHSETGGYEFTYTASDSSVWSGNYSITAKKEGLLDSGARDASHYYSKFNLSCKATGPSFYEDYSTSSKSSVQKGGDGGQSKAESDTRSSMKSKNTIEDVQYGGELTVIEKNEGNYRMRVEFKRLAPGLYDN